MNFIELNEIVGPAETKKIMVLIGSINTIRHSDFCGMDATQVNLQNDCIFVTESVDDIIKKIDLSL